MKYSVPITRKILEVYVVEARNGSEAAFKAAELRAEGTAPDQVTDLGHSVSTARPLINEPDADTV